MGDRLGRWYRGLPRAVRFGIWALFVVGFCGGGWLAGRRFSHDPTLGVLAGLGVAGFVYGAIYADTRVIIVDSIMTFLLGVPLIYLLVLLVQIPLLAFGLVPFSAHTYYVNSIFGALVSTGVSVLGNVKGTFEKASESSTDKRFDMQRWFLNGVSFRTAIAFVLASLFVVPGAKPLAMITLGVAWGVVAATVQLVFTVLVDHESVREGWPQIVILEVLVVMCLLVGLAIGISNYPVVGQSLELGIPAVLSCAVTYGLVYLIATATTQLRAAATVAAVGPIERRRWAALGARQRRRRRSYRHRDRRAFRRIHHDS